MFKLRVKLFESGKNPIEQLPLLNLSIFLMMIASEFFVFVLNGSCSYGILNKLNPREKSNGTGLFSFNYGTLLTN